MAAQTKWYWHRNRYIRTMEQNGIPQNNPNVFPLNDIRQGHEENTVERGQSIQ